MTGFWTQEITDQCYMWRR